MATRFSAAMAATGGAAATAAALGAASGPGTVVRPGILPGSVVVTKPGVLSPSGTTVRAAAAAAAAATFTATASAFATKVLPEADVKSMVDERFPVPLAGRSNATRLGRTEDPPAKSYAPSETAFHERSVSFCGYFKESVPESATEVRSVARGRVLGGAYPLSHHTTPHHSTIGCAVVALPLPDAALLPG